MSTPLARLAIFASLLALACSRPTDSNGMEEVHAAESDVPLVVRTAAQRICKRIGGDCALGQWAWDQEDEDWECEVLGLPRTSELDILPDGRFSEFELVYTLAEIEQQLPGVAETIRSKCRTDSGTVVELSLRDEEHLDPFPELSAAWKQSNVVIEFQCANGSDFELDARGMILEDRLDDVETTK